MKIQTVNVIEIIDDAVKQITSFSDDKEGNKEAEELFLNLVKENAKPSILTPEDLEFYLEEGYFNTSDYTLFLVHS